MRKLFACFLILGMVCAMSATIGCGKTEEKPKAPTTPPAEQKK